MDSRAYDNDDQKDPRQNDRGEDRSDKGSARRRRSRSYRGQRSRSGEKSRQYYGSARDGGYQRSYGAGGSGHGGQPNPRDNYRERDRGDPRSNHHRNGRDDRFENGRSYGGGHHNGGGFGMPPSGMAKYPSHGGGASGRNDYRQATQARSYGYGMAESYSYNKGVLDDMTQHDSPPEPIKKDFYVEHEITKNRSEADNQKFMLENGITATGLKVPRPVQQFDESNLPKYLVDKLKSSPKFEAPTPIQSQAWPVALSGRDVIGVAQTGSGKTLAFIIPAIVHVMAQPVLKQGDGPIVLVMAPTRELAMQIEVETRRFADVCQLSSLAIFGGVPKGDQQRKLRQGVEILIATPGRLLDFLDSRETNLRRITYLVLDEADRMLDMGFEKDIRKIIGYINHPDRQTTMFSATWPVEIQQMAQNFCTMAPIQIKIGNQAEFDGGLTINADIEQNIHILDSNYEKYQTLTDLLLKMMQNEQQHKIIIFCQTKAGVNNLERSLRNDQRLSQEIKFEVRGIHGDKLQRDRDDILYRFKVPLEGFVQQTFNYQMGQTMQRAIPKSNILVATDVASRGLDVKDISIVINYDMPTCIEDYIHRIGRTGRAGKKGNSHSFLTKKELGLVNDLVKILKKTNQYISPQLYELKRFSYQQKNENRYRKWRKPGDYNQMDNGPNKFAKGDFGNNFKRDNYQDQRGQRDFGAGNFGAGRGAGGNGYQPAGYDYGQQYRNGYQNQNSFQNKRDQKDQYKVDGYSRNYSDPSNAAYLTELSQQRFTQQDFKSELFGNTMNSSVPQVPINAGNNLQQKLNPASLAGFGEKQDKINPEGGAVLDMRYQESDDKPRSFAGKASDEPRERVAEPMPSTSGGDGQSTNIVYRKVWGAQQQQKNQEEGQNGNDAQ